MDSLGNLIKGHMKDRSGIAASVYATQVVEHAQRTLHAIFPKLSKRVEIVSFQNGALRVRALSGAAAAELRLREQQFLAQCNTQFGKKVIHRLRYIA